MSAIIAFALKITFGLAANKLRRYLGDRLKDGDLNAQMAREVIVSELAKVKTKLEGLARSDLLSSVSFLEEGFDTLSGALPNMADEENREGSVVISADATQKLVEAIGKLKETSTDHFTSAMTSFEKANTKATEAFHNEALGIEDRILAAKLRVQSRLLMSLENPDLATTCKLYLKELHRVPAVVEIFRNAIEGGVLSALNKAKRLELALSVSVINFTVFRFLKGFTKGPVNLYDWPMVKRDDWKYNVLIPDQMILEQLKKAGEEVPNFMLREPLKCHPGLVAVDSEGHLIIFVEKMNRREKNTRELLKVTNNDVKVLYKSPCYSGPILPVAIDSGNNVYIIERMSSPGCYHLDDCLTSHVFHVVDPQGNIKEFGVTNSYGAEALAPTPEGCNIAVCMGKDDYFKGKAPGIFCLHINQWRYCGMATITDKYEVVAVGQSGYVVRVYKKDGQLEKEFELYEGEQEHCLGITFNNLTKEVVVVSRVKDCDYLSTYLPETGQRHHHVKLPQYLIGKVKKDRFYWRDFPDLNLTSHSSGVIALITEEHVLYIQ